MLEIIKNNIFKIIIIITLIIFFVWSSYISISYKNLYLFIIILGGIIFLYGLYKNKDKTYKSNLNLYFLLYFIALIYTTFIINRFISFDFKFNHDYFHLIPFNLIYTTIHDHNLSTLGLIINYLGNFLMLIPLSLLLILKDKKYLLAKKMFLTLFLLTLTIEVLEVLLGVGVFDVDDFLMNISGGMMLLFLFKNPNIYKIFYNIFNPKLNINKYISNIIFILVIGSLIIINLFMISDINKYHKYDIKRDFIRGLNAKRVTSFEIEDYEIYIDEVLVVYKDKLGIDHELDQESSDSINYEIIINAVNFIEDRANYKYYKGENVNIYECKNYKKIIFTRGLYKELYCKS